MQVSFTVSKALIKQIDDLAKKTKKSRSSTIEMLLTVAIKSVGSGKMTEAQTPNIQQLMKIMREGFDDQTRKLSDFEQRLRKLEEAK